MTAKRIAGLAAAVACGVWAGGAQAATFDVTLSGVVGDTAFTTADVPGTHIDFGFLELTDNTPVTISEGDTVNATVNLDTIFKIPGSVDLTSISLNLFGTDFPDVNTGSGGTISLLLGGNLVATATFPTGETTRGQIFTQVNIGPPGNGEIDFDSITASITPYDLGGNTVTLNQGEIEYALFRSTAVPEPASWALMLVGFGGLGGVLRSVRRRAFA
jgi:hypothetical protein